MKFTGVVKDASTGQPLPFANVYWSNKNGTPDYKNWGTTTNGAGAYNLGTDIGSLNITASFIGYARQTKPIPTSFVQNAVINFNLVPEAINLSGVTITASPIKKVNYTTVTIIILIIAAIVALKYYL